MNFLTIAERHEKKKLKIKERRKHCFKFYRQFVGIVEAVGPYGNLHNVYFQKPFIIQHLSQFIADDVVINAIRTSDEERIENYDSKIPLYVDILKFRAKI